MRQSLRAAWIALFTGCLAVAAAGCQGNGQTGLNVIVEGCTGLGAVGSLQVTLQQPQGSAQQAIDLGGRGLPVQFEADLDRTDIGRTLVEVQALSAAGQPVASARAEAHVVAGQVVPVSVDLCLLLDGGPFPADGGDGGPDAADGPDMGPDGPANDPPIINPDGPPPPDAPPVDGPDLGLRCGDEVRINLQTDPDNCGVCGHVCQEGDCVAGQCTPRVLTGASLTPVAMTVDQSRVMWLAIDPSTTDGQLLKLDKNLGTTAPVMLAPVVDPVALTTADSQVFWIGGTTGTELHGIPAEGGPDTTLSTDGPFTAVASAAARPELDTPTRLVVASGGASSSIQSVALDGSGLIPVATAGFTDPAALAVDFSQAFFAANRTGEQDHSILAAAFDGSGKVQTVAAHVGKVLALAIDPSYVYWLTNGGEVARQLKPGAMPPPAGEAPIEVGTIATLSCTPLQFVLDADFLYFPCPAGVGRVGKGGTPMESFPTGPATNVAVDSLYIYWQAPDGSVHRLTK
jgi:hypothetical protein